MLSSFKCVILPFAHSSLTILFKWIALGYVNLFNLLNVSNFLFTIVNSDFLISFNQIIF